MKRCTCRACKAVAVAHYTCKFVTSSLPSPMSLLMLSNDDFVEGDENVLALSHFLFTDVDECKNNAGMKKNSVCVNGECQNTMKDYICVCNAGFRSDVTKKLCNGNALQPAHCSIVVVVFAFVRGGGSA